MDKQSLRVDLNYVAQALGASEAIETLPECTWETGSGNDYRLARDIDRAKGSDEQSVLILFDKKLGRIVNN